MNTTTLTAGQRAKQINDGARDKWGQDCGILCEEESHWTDYGIITGEELDKYLCWSDLSDTYKELHGFRPRWEWQCMSLEQLEACLHGLIETGNRARAWEEQEERDIKAREVAAFAVVPLTTSMAAFWPR